MAILGTLIDRQTISRAGDALGSAGAGITLTTLPHSLPATNPEFIDMVLRSVQGIGAGGAPELVAVGGNASLLTIGFAVPSQASCPTILFDVVAYVFHTVVR